jgi:hypothetical protein
VAAHVAVNSVMFMLSVANVKKWLRIWRALNEKCQRANGAIALLMTATMVVEF